MKVQTMTIRYDEKRSRNYNSAGVGMEMTVTLDEGDIEAQVFDQILADMKSIVGSECKQAIYELAHAASMDHN